MLLRQPLLRWCLSSSRAPNHHKCSQTADDHCNACGLEQTLWKGRDALPATMVVMGRPNVTLPRRKWGPEASTDEVTALPKHNGLTTKAEAVCRFAQCVAGGRSERRSPSGDTGVHRLRSRAGCVSPASRRLLREGHAWGAKCCRSKKGSPQPMSNGPHNRGFRKLRSIRNYKVFGNLSETADFFLFLVQRTKRFGAL